MSKWIIAILVVVILAGSYMFIRNNPSIMNPAAAQPTPEARITNSQLLEPTGTFEVETSEPEYFETSKGFFARPANDEVYPGVVMIHEWWGLNDNIKEMAEKLASEGYMVLAVDLYEGHVAKNQQEARQYVGEVNQETADANMKAAYDYLKKNRATNVASLGWCFGGGKSLAMAVSGVPLAGTVIYYGTPLITDRDQLAAIKWPVLGVFGDKDQAIPVDKVKEFENALNDLKIENDIHVYPGVGHAFANPSSQTYAPEPTRDAWAKTLAFLKTNLQ